MLYSLFVMHQVFNLMSEFIHFFKLLHRVVIDQVKKSFVIFFYFLFLSFYCFYELRISVINDYSFHDSYFTNSDSILSMPDESNRSI